MNRRRLDLDYQCFSCGNIKKITRWGLFCRATCFYKYIGLNINKLDKMSNEFRRSSELALENLQENA